MKKTLSLFLILIFVIISSVGCNDNSAKKVTQITPTIIKDFNENVSNYTSELLMYNMEYQKPLVDKMSSLKKAKEYTIDDPLVIYNPYKTDYLALYVYFENKAEVYLDYKIYSVDENILPLSKSFKKDYSGNSLINKSTEFLLTGLVNNSMNIIELKTYNKSDKFVKGVSFEFDTTNLSPYIPDNSKIEYADYDKIESNAFYFTSSLIASKDLENPPKYEQSHYFGATLIDTKGYVRSYIVCPLYKIDRPIFYKDKFIYTVSRGHIAVVNMKGELENVFCISDDDITIYTLHHDLWLDGDNLIALASLEGSAIDEDDMFFKIDLNTYKKEMLFRLSDLVGVEASSKQNWSHVNSMFLEDGKSGEKDMYLSLRYRSTMLKITNIYSNPKISYIFNATDFFDNIGVPKLKPKDKVKEKNMIAGQHTITIIRENILPNIKLTSTQYFLLVYNNLAYQGDAIKDLVYEDFVDMETLTKGKQSAVQIYLVDEKDMSYENVFDVRLKKSFAQGGVEYLDHRLIAASAQNSTINEIDIDGNIIFEAYARRPYRAFKFFF